MANLVQRPEFELTRFHGMVTVAPNMRALFELLTRVAGTNASVLLRGETGTGKELAAGALHALSHRKAGPFVAVNCATLTPDLAASELFGHQRGAFTGAVSNRVGLFARAKGGTVFLDEVAELSLDIQARLLRVLQERNFVPLGASDPIEADVRLITATHTSLREQVEQRRFREDLMYRIRVVPLQIPPLAERPGDVEALFWQFVDELGPKANRTVTALTEQAHALLLRYPFPGNVRELRNFVEYALAVGEHEYFGAADFPPEFRGESYRKPRVTSRPEPEEPQERDEIARALKDANGQKSLAAELLGISRTTLWRRMRELRLL